MDKWVSKYVASKWVRKEILEGQKKVSKLWSKEKKELIVRRYGKWISNEISK